MSEKEKEPEKIEEAETAQENSPKKRSGGGFFKRLFVLLILVLMLVPFGYYYGDDFEARVHTFLDRYVRTSAPVPEPVPAYPAMAEYEEPAAVDIAREIIRDREHMVQQAVERAEAIAVGREYADAFAGMRQEMAVLGSRLDEIESAADDSESLTDLQVRLEKAEAEVARLNRERSNQGIAFVLLQLKMRIDMGKPYQHELAILEALLPADAGSLEAVKPLAKYAAAGIPTLPELARQFNEFTKPRKIAAVIPEGASWFDALLIKLRSFVSVTKVDKNSEISGLMAAVDNARKELAANDLQAAVLSFDPNEELSETLAEWLEKAKIRIESEAIINSLMGNAIVLFTAERLM